MTAGESHWFSTVETMPWIKRARRFGMIAVCGNGSPSGWRNNAVTANQSATPPTTAASKPAAATVIHARADGATPESKTARVTTAPVTAISSETVPTWLRRGTSAGSGCIGVQCLRERVRGRKAISLGAAAS